MGGADAPGVGGNHIVTEPLFPAGSLHDGITALRKDLMAEGGPQISTMRNYNFAILPYPPADEFKLRREIRKLVENDSSLGERLHPSLPYIAAEVVWAVKEEMARTVDDVLSRRLRATFLNEKAAKEMTPRVEELIRTVSREA